MGKVEEAIEETIEGDIDWDNFNQRLPYEAQAIVRRKWYYNMLGRLLRGITNEIGEEVSVGILGHSGDADGCGKLKRIFPEEYEKMRSYIEVLPMKPEVHGDPFTGIILNVGVATDAHRDPGDKGPCAVFSLGEYRGAELVLEELGLVIDHKPGSVVFFASKDLTHFNMHYDGVRGSVVLAHDSQGDRWLKDWNHWGPFIDDGKRKGGIEGLA